MYKCWSHELVLCGCAASTPALAPVRFFALIIIIIITTTIFIVLSSMAPAIRESSLQFIWAKVGQRQLVANSQAKLQIWPLSPPVGCHRPNIIVNDRSSFHPFSYFIPTIPHLLLLLLTDRWTTQNFCCNKFHDRNSNSNPNSATQHKQQNNVMQENTTRSTAGQ